MNIQQAQSNKWRNQRKKTRGYSMVALGSVDVALSAGSEGKKGIVCVRILKIHGKAKREDAPELTLLVPPCPGTT